MSQEIQEDPKPSFIGAWNVERRDITRFSGNDWSVFYLWVPEEGRAFGYDKQGLSEVTDLNYDGISVSFRKFYPGENVPGISRRDIFYEGRGLGKNRGYEGVWKSTEGSRGKFVIVNPNGNLSSFEKFVSINNVLSFTNEMVDRRTSLPYSLLKEALQG